jgi:hypothetical protein
MANQSALNRISQAPETSSVFLDRCLNKWDASALMKRGNGDTCPTNADLFPGTEYLVIDGQWKRFNVSKIINSLRISESVT